MGKGRKPLPTEVKRLQGTFRKDQSIDHIQGSSLKEIPPHPENFNEMEIKLWDALTTFLYSNKILQNIGLPNIISWCRFMGRHLEAEDWIAENGAIYNATNKEGEVIPKTHPYHRISIETNQQAQRIGAEFGVTPATQTKILASLGYPKNDLDDDDFT